MGQAWRQNLKLTRVPFLACAIFLLLVAVWGGLARMGWLLGLAVPSDFVTSHGPLMVPSFFAAVIALERAVEVGLRWRYAAPTLALAAGFSWMLGRAGMAVVFAIAASLVYLMVCLSAFWVRPSASRMLEMVGATSLLFGNVVFAATQTVPDVVAAWMVFLILTISAERYAVGAPGLTTRILYATGAAALTIGAAFWPWVPLVAARLFGGGSLLMAACELASDTGIRRPEQQPYARYMAWALVLANVWLVTAGIFFLLAGSLTAGFDYDVGLHAVFLGFVFSMLIGHGPAVFPQLLGFSASFSRFLYAPLMMLQIGSAIRFGSGILQNHTARMWGGLLQGLAVILFLAGVGVSILRSQKKTTLGI